MNNNNTYSFEEAFNATGENGWKLSQGESADQIVTDSVKGKCARLRGNLSKNKNLMQTVKVSGKEGDVFVFGCSVKADAIPGRIFRVRAVVHFTDKTTTETIVNCNPYVTEWQFVNGVILTRKDGSTTNKTYESIQIYLEYQKQQNDAFFTGLQLIRDDAESYVYDANGNIVSAKTAAEQNAFTCNKTDLLSKMVKVTGSSFEYEYDGKKNMTAARNSEGVQYRYTYDTKGNPQDVVIHHDRVSTSVMAGRSYYIRHRKSGKYIDVKDASNKDGAAVQQYEFSGSSEQKWHIEDAGEGYIIFKAFDGNGTYVLDIGTDANGAKAKLAAYANKDSQKFRIKPVGEGMYLITSKISKDKKAIDLPRAQLDNSIQLQIWDQSETHPNQQWYFEPVAYERKSDQPISGGIYMMRLGYSGQYMQVNGTTAGSTVVQNRYLGKEAQMFLIHGDETGGFFLEPANAEGKALSMASDGTLTLQVKNTSDSKQKFWFEVSEEDKNNYCIKQNSRFFMIPSLSHEENTAINGAYPTVEAMSPQEFILEKCSERMTAQYTYTATGRNVKTLTDARGFVTTNEYDSKERLLTGVTDAKGNKVTYTYDTKNDLLTGATASDGTNTVKLGYTYDEGDRLKTIAHNGFEYTYEYDFLGNQTRILAGGNALEEYDYLPSDGPLSEVKYATGEVLKNSYDKYEQIVEQKWNGTTVFRNIYDDYGNVFYHEDLENDRKIFFDYDMIQRMAGYRTTDGETARIQYDNKNRRTGMVHQIDDSKISTSCVFGEVGKAQAPEISVAEPKIAPVPADAPEEVKKIANLLEEKTPEITGLDTVAADLIRETENGDVIVKTGEDQTISGVEAKEKLQKEGVNTAGKKVRLVVEPYMSVEVKGVTEKQGVNVITFEITALYNVKATTAGKNETMQEEGTGRNTILIGTAIPQKVGIPVTITLPLPADYPTEDLFIRHLLHSGKIAYYPVTVKKTQGSVMVEFVNKDGFSTFELLSDSRKGTVAFDHGVGERSYSLEQMDEALPTVSKDGVVFKGWKINGTLYTTVNEALLDVLDQAEGHRVTAQAVLESSSPETPDNPKEDNKPGSATPDNPKGDRNTGSGSDREDTDWNVTRNAWETKKVNGVVRWSYYDSDGRRVFNVWKQLLYEGTMFWYHFGADGYMDTGWFKDADGNWYYLNQASDGTQGTMKTGWFKDTDGNWYYLNPVSDGTRGAMKTGWFKDVDGNWYYLNPVSDGTQGAMKTGWFTDPQDGHLYYLDPKTGAMVTGNIQNDSV